MVSCETPKISASSPTLTEPTARNRCTISLWRRTASGRTMQPRGTIRLFDETCGLMTRPGLSSASCRPDFEKPASAARAVALGELTVVVEHSLEQHLRAGGALLLGGEFRLVVADPAAAGNENHRGRRNARNICCVVARAGNDFPCRKSAD